MRGEGEGTVGEGMSWGGELRVGGGEGIGGARSPRIRERTGSAELSTSSRPQLQIVCDMEVSCSRGRSRRRPGIL